MTQDILEELQRELVNGYAKRGHPFRYFTLATTENNSSRLRTVVLRKILPDFTCIVYTDLRSQKIEAIRKNNNVNALFYNPKKLMQVSIKAEAEILSNPEEIKQYWGNVAVNSKKDYTTELAPGSKIKAPDLINYNETEHHFCVLKLKPKYIEYLRLKRPNHLRVGFSKHNNEFKGEFLVP